MDQPQNTVFVGQVPRDMPEHELRQFMEDCGRVMNINMLTDRATGQFKGCAFVTYETVAAATAAKETFHDQHRLPGASHAMQVTTARSKTNTPSAGGYGPPPSERADSHLPRRKLFVGMLSRAMSDEELQELFQTFGAVEDCIILRNSDKSSKGCAFVTMSSMSDCQKAIVALHNSQTFPGCSGPIVVKFADTPTQKETRQRGRDGPGVMGGGPPPQLGGMGHGGHGGGAHRPHVPMLSGPPPPHYGSQAPPQHMGGNALPGGGGGAGPGLSNLQSLLAPTMAQLVKQQQELQQQQQTINQALQMLGLPGAGRGDYSAPAPESIPFGGGARDAGPAAAVDRLYDAPHASSFHAPQQPGPGSAAAAAAGSGYRTGPDGSNLFIYHLSSDLTDSDLHALFAPYGHVISARVYCDRNTGVSKGFGFVSYDNAQSAQAAIQGLNGYQMGSRRLKVQLKKGRDQARPY